ncbi:hypothetical protein RclHR1_43260001, partial [Rhizophagus clarus]
TLTLLLVKSANPRGGIGYNTKKNLQIFWQGIIKENQGIIKEKENKEYKKEKEYEKETSSIETYKDIPVAPTITFLSRSKFNCYNFSKRNNKVIKHPMDLFTINSKLENEQYTNLEEFEYDVRLIFCNCYTYNDVKSEIYCSGEALESIFNKKWNEKLIFQTRRKGELKRVRDKDTDNDNTVNDNSNKEIS